MRQRTFLKIVIVVLLFILALLVYLYWSLIRPPRPAVAPEVKGIIHLFSIYGYGTKPHQLLNKPHGVAVDKEGNIYIADTGNHRILVFDRKGNFLFKFGKTGRNQGEMMFPLNIAIAPAGDIYVTLMALSKMLIYDSEGKFIKEVPIDRPIAITAERGKLYVATAGQIFVLDLDGNILSKWGRQGKVAGQFEYPNGIGLDKKGNIFISDTNNDRIQIFDKDSKLIGIKGEPPKSLNDPDRLFGLGVGLAIDDEEKVYVVDTFRHAIRVFDHDGNDLEELGRRGSAETEFSYPSTIAYAGEKVFALADQGNNRVQVLKIYVSPKKPKGKAR